MSQIDIVRSIIGLGILALMFGFFACASIYEVINGYDELKFEAIVFSGITATIMYFIFRIALTGMI